MTRPEPESGTPPPFAIIARLVRARRAALWTALGYFAVVAVAGLALHVTGDLEAESDFFDSYILQAQSFLHGAVAVDPYRGPVYPILLALFSLPLRLFGAGYFESGILLSVLSGAALLYFNQRLLSRWVEPTTALVATLLAALNWVFVRYSYTAGNDMTFAALGTMVLFAMFSPRAGHGWRPAALGLLCGITYLTRYNGIVLLLAMLAAVFAFDLWHLPWNRRVRACLLLVAGFAVVLVPWALYCKAQTGVYFYNKNYLNVAYGAYMTTERTTEQFLASHPDTFNGFHDVFFYNPARLLLMLTVHCVGHTVLVLHHVLSWPVSLFMIPGFISLFFRDRPRGLGVYALTGAVFYSLLFLVFYSDRFVLLLIPIACAFAARGVVVVSRALSSRTRIPHPADFLFLALFIFSMIGCVGSNRSYIRGANSVFREMGEGFAREHPDHDRNAVVVARKAYFGYFAGLRTAPLPLVQSHEALMDYVHRVGADYLFFSYVAFNTRTALTYLSDPQQPHPGLVLLAIAARSPEGVFRGALYRVEKESGRKDEDETRPAPGGGGR